jgi:uncharacterized protein YecT (DUF1311 family)
MGKKLIFILTLFIAVSASAQSQTAMNSDAKGSYKKVDDELGVVYQQILKKYSKNTKFIDALRASERLWIQFRDAEVKMMYPAEDTRMAYGSMYSLLYYSYLEVLTKARTKNLRRWLSTRPQDSQGSIGDYDGDL